MSTLYFDQLIFVLQNNLILFEYLYHSLYLILSYTGAHISWEGAMAYIWALIVATILIFPYFEKRTRFTAKKKLIPISIILIVSSILVFYFPLYDIITNIPLQIVLTILSIIMFALGMGGLVQAFLKIHMP